MNTRLKTFIGNKYHFLSVFLLSVVFAISHTQSPLYTSNQNTYLLHGLANGNLGFLSYDWMANTTDPFPIFSLLVSLTYSNASTFLFYIYYAIILAIFIFSIMGIASVAWERNRSNLECFTSYVVITSICSAAFAYLSYKLIGINLSNIVLNGVAGQYILGPVFQPSTFGVFLLLSVYTFLKDKPFLAVVFLGVAANLHATYLLSAATLTLSYMTIIILEENKYRKALLVGLLSLIIVAPVVIYSFFSFASTSTDTLSQAQSILVDYRIPHHANISVWFGADTLIKFAIIILALLMLRRSRIWLIILIPILISIALTLIQILTESHFLALLFPWRISTFLIPLSFFSLASGAIYYIFQRYAQIINNHRKAINLLLTIVLFCIFSFGVLKLFLINKNHNEAEFTPMMAFVTETMVKDDIYLIPLELEQFRLQTGSRILVDKKTHPYKDVEVIGWYDRILLANRFYTVSTESQCDVLNEISYRYGVTHVVISNEKNILNCDFLHIIFNDGIYSVYKIKDYK